MPVPTIPTRARRRSHPRPAEGRLAALDLLRLFAPVVVAGIVLLYTRSEAALARFIAAGP
jgi:hypothetical protein